MTVLILATERDVSADRMVRALTNRNVPVFRADLSWFPQQLSFDAELRDGRWTGRLATPYHEVTLEELRPIWYRNPSSFQFPMTMSNAERQHAQHEAKLGLGGVLGTLPVHWVNHPSRHADAGYKPRQLVAAARAGLGVAPTLVTNNPGAVRRFAHPIRPRWGGDQDARRVRYLRVGRAPGRADPAVDRHRPRRSTRCRADRAPRATVGTEARRSPRHRDQPPRVRGGHPRAQPSRLRRLASRLQRP